MNDNNRNSRRRTGGRKTRVALIILCVILALLLLLLVTGAAFLETTLNKINRVQDTTEYTLSQSEIDDLYATDPGDATADPDIPTMHPDDVTWDTVPTFNTGDEIVNILLIGQDRREGQGRQRSDAMILCTFNTEKKTLTMTSFLRDTYVQIPGYQDNRINAAYALGGMKLLDSTLNKNFGVEVDGNVEVDFGQFTDIIDLLDGVDINLTSAEANYLNSGTGWNLTKGVNHLNGEQALAYSRIRYLDSDFGRTGRQRKVLSALIQAYKDLPVTKMLSLLDDILPMITTDMTNSQIVNYALELFPMLSTCTITSQYIPADGAYESRSIRGMAVLVPDLVKAQRLLAETIGG